MEINLARIAGDFGVVDLDIGEAMALGGSDFLTWSIVPNESASPSSFTEDSSISMSENSSGRRGGIALDNANKTFSGALGVLPPPISFNWARMSAIPERSVPRMLAEMRAERGSRDYRDLLVQGVQVADAAESR